MSINKFDALLARLRRELTVCHQRCIATMGAWAKEVERRDRLIARIDELEANAPPRSVRERKAREAKP